jgi:ribosomal protein S27AE
VPVERMKDKIISWIKEKVDRGEGVPSVRAILKHFNINRRRFYSLFPQGLQGIAKELGLGLSQDRLRIVKPILKERELENDPEIIKLKKELIKAELKRKIRENKLPFELEKQIKELEERIDGLDEILTDLINKVYDIPITEIKEKYKCENCGEKGLVAIHAKCTNCGREFWWGFWPEE